MFLGKGPIITAHGVLPPVDSRAVPTANVTLRTVTIAKQYAWLMNPNFFIVCGSEPRVYLTDVKKAGQLYEFTGNETWQVRQIRNG